jgi:hypothetical protein
MTLWAKTDADNSRPKYLNSADLAKCIFVDITEAQQATNKKRGLTHGGWWLYSTYTDSQGTTRHKAECLVALAETALAAGDRADDTKAADATYTITIGTQPADQETAGGAATFTVAATVSSGGGTLAYQWQVKAVGEANWADVDGETADSLVLAAQEAGNTGDQYRVKVTSAGGASEVISDVATLTFGD